MKATRDDHRATWDRMQVRLIKTADGCWLWSGSVNNRGYGTVGTRVQRTRLAHRIAYIATRGMISPDLVVDHLCHNVDPSCAGGPNCKHRQCCNPDHLEAVPAGVNLDRSPVVVARRATGKAECNHGHQMTEANTIIAKLQHGKTSRACRECKRARDRARWVPRSQRKVTT